MQNFARLSQLKFHTDFSSAQAVVVGYDGLEDLVIRLQELGVRIGAEVSLVGRAPFRGPWLIRLGTTVIALREEEASCLRLEVRA